MIDGILVCGTWRGVFLMFVLEASCCYRSVYVEWRAMISVGSEIYFSMVSGALEVSKGMFQLHVYLIIYLHVIKILSPYRLLISFVAPLFTADQCIAVASCFPYVKDVVGCNPTSYVRLTFHIIVIVGVLIIGSKNRSMPPIFAALAVRLERVMVCCCRALRSIGPFYSEGIEVGPLRLNVDGVCKDPSRDLLNCKLATRETR